MTVAVRNALRMLFGARFYLPPEACLNRLSRRSVVIQGIQEFNEQAMITLLNFYSGTLATLVLSYSPQYTLLS